MALSFRNIFNNLSLTRVIAGVTSFQQVRYAQFKKRLPKKYYELTDMANWRRERGMEVNPNKFGPLTNLPDYSYLDGRPVPLSLNLKGRLEHQKILAEAIFRLSGEVDFAKERYQQKQHAKAERRSSVVNNKLRPKGPALHANERINNK